MLPMTAPSTMKQNESGGWQQPRAMSERHGQLSTLCGRTLPDPDLNCVMFEPDVHSMQVMLQGPFSTSGCW
jgi:hypothetical protein